MRNTHTATEQHHRTRWKHSISAAVAHTRIVILTGILVLTGCSAGNTPTPTETAGANPPTSTSAVTVPPSTTAPPTTAAYQAATANGPAQNVPIPTLPAKAKEFSKEGLLAFAEYWYATLGYAFETGDAGPMMAVTGSGCLNCGAMKETVVSWHSEGRWIVGGQMYVISQTTSFEPVEDGTYQVVSMVRQQNVKFYRQDKTLAGDRGPQPAIADILVANYSSDRWAAVTVDHLEGSKGSKG